MGKLNPAQDEEFESAIAKYLELRLYKKRGMTKDEYIEKCKSLWDECEVDEEYEYKILIDKLMPISDSIRICGFDYDDELFREEPVSEVETQSLYCAPVLLVRSNGTKVKKTDTDEDPLSVDPPDLKPMPYIIALFDVLGFSNKLETTGLEEMLLKYERMIDEAVIKDSWRSLGRVQVGKDLYCASLFNLPVRYAYFSDTILLWVPLVPHFVAPFTARCTDLVCEALNTGLTLRGSITIGKAVMNKDLSTYLGLPIVEAYNLEKAQMWIGLSFGCSATWPEFQKQLDLKFIMQDYVQHFKPGNDDLISSLVLDWPRRWREKFGSTDLIGLLDRLNTNKRYEKYYINTVDFVNYSKEHADWYRTEK